jgi:hypothetical protein
MSYLGKEIGIETATWILKMIGKKGGVKINTNIYNHNDDLSHNDKLKRGEIITLGKKDEPVTVEDCLAFLKKVGKYASHEDFDNGRSYFFEGIEKDGKGYEFVWGS